MAEIWVSMTFQSLTEVRAVSESNEKKTPLETE